MNQIMSHAGQRLYLIRALLDERNDIGITDIPNSADEQKRLLRALMNVRPPMPASKEFLRIQDEYLREETARKGVTDANALSYSPDGIALWRGDITTLKCDAIVNAANSQMLGCFCPNHGCIDNAIHTFAGVELRLYCADIMRRQGHDEPTGMAKLTPGFNLPCGHVLHTVGPIIYGEPSDEDCAALGACYNSCLDAAQAAGLKSVAFCCISTGEFHFPNKLAAQIALDTVRAHSAVKRHEIRVIFNVFKQYDEDIYNALLAKSC